MYTASGSKAYAQIGVESAVMSASQQQLVTMLFDGVLSALVRARLFMQDNNQQGKGVSLSKAINIIENGLRVSLDEESKDELTQNLIALYSYMVRRLLQANLRNDVSAVEEVEALMRNIADAERVFTLPFFDSGPSLMNHAPHLYFAATTRRKKPAHVTPGNGRTMGRTHRQRNGVCECGAGDCTSD